MIHFFYRSHAKKPESGLFSDWISNNTEQTCTVLIGQNGTIR